MYECRFLNLKEMQTFLGLGRNRTLRLCQEHTHNFPAVMVGNRYWNRFGCRRERYDPHGDRV